MQKHVLYTFIMSLLCTVASAQFTIKGAVMDQTTKELIPFATLVLTKSSSDTVVQSTSSDQKGQFKFLEVSKGWYDLKIMFIGYPTTKRDSIWVNSDLNLNNVPIQTSVEIEKVVIKNKKQNTVLKLDKKVFSISENPNSIGGTATEALNNLPSVTVDDEGNISLRGSTNLRILIDGKPTGLTGEDIGLILQQIPASSIENIEVITVPSAKFDAESAGGVINIVLKKEKKQGNRGAFSGNWGTLDKINLAGNWGLNRKKIQLNFNSSAQTGTFSSNRTATSQNSAIDTLDLFNTQGQGSRLKRNLLGKVSFTYLINDSSKIDASSSGNIGESITTNDTYYDWFYNNGTSTESLLRITQNDDQSTNVINSISFDKQFKQQTHLQLSSTHNYIAKVGNGIFDENTNPQQESSKQTTNDYIQNIDITKKYEKGKTELGAQYTHRTINNVFNFLENNTGLNIGNNYKYSDDILAAYLVQSFELKSWEIAVGYRMEHTNSNSNNQTTNEVYKRNYFLHFPSLNLAKKINKQQRFGLNYSKRVTRPNARQLNPSPSLSDPFFLRAGNPSLVPATNDVSELTWVYKKKQQSFQSTLYYQYRKNRVRRVLFTDSKGVSTLQWVNYDREDYYGIELVGNFEIGSHFNNTISGNLYERNTDGSNIDPNYKTRYWGWELKYNFNITLPNSFIFSANAQYLSAKGLVFGTFQPRYFVDLALSKSVFKKKGKVALRLADAFNIKDYRIDTQINDWNRNVQFKRESRILFISFNYSFAAAAPSNNIENQ